MIEKDASKVSEESTTTKMNNDLHFSSADAKIGYLSHCRLTEHVLIEAKKDLFFVIHLLPNLKHQFEIQQMEYKIVSFVLFTASRPSFNDWVNVTEFECIKLLIDIFLFVIYLIYYEMFTQYVVFICSRRVFICINDYKKIHLTKS